MFIITQEDIVLIEKALKGTRPSYEIQGLVQKLKSTIRALNHQIIKQELKATRDHVGAGDTYTARGVDVTRVILEQMVD